METRLSVIKGTAKQRINCTLRNGNKYPNTFRHNGTRINCTLRNGNTLL